jgi:nucleoside-diphosphate-sugar epimerase
MRVLITGHHGYIGSVLAPFLAADGHDVVGIDSNYFVDCLFGEAPPEIEQRLCDIREVMPEDLAGFDAVCHLAALSNDPLGNLNPRLTAEINHLASVRLARLAKQAGVSRFIFSSSCSLYGSAGSEMLTESASFEPITPYAASKVAVEQEVSKLADESFTPVFLRNATAYGVSPRLRLDLVLNEFVACSVLQQIIVIRSDGTPWRPVVHVEDICRAFAAVLTAPRGLVHNQAFNVGRSDENYRVNELAEMVCQAVPGCTVEYAAGGGPDRRCYRVDCSKLPQHVPAFQPKWNVRRGIAQLISACSTYARRHYERKIPSFAHAPAPDRDETARSEPASAGTRNCGRAIVLGRNVSLI